MAETIAIVDNSGVTTTATVVDSTSVLLASTNLAGSTTVQSISDIGDVDTSTNGKTDGSILVYKAITNMWTSTKTLDAQNMEGGEF